MCGYHKYDPNTMICNVFMPENLKLTFIYLFLFFLNVIWKYMVVQNLVRLALNVCQSLGVNICCALMIHKPQYFNCVTTSILTSTHKPLDPAIFYATFMWFNCYHCTLLVDFYVYPHLRNARHILFTGVKVFLSCCYISFFIQQLIMSYRNVKIWHF